MPTPQCHDVRAQHHGRSRPSAGELGYEPGAGDAGPGLDPAGRERLLEVARGLVLLEAALGPTHPDVATALLARNAASFRPD